MVRRALQFKSWDGVECLLAFVLSLKRRGCVLLHEAVSNQCDCGDVVRYDLRVPALRLLPKCRSLQFELLFGSICLLHGNCHHLRPEAIEIVPAHPFDYMCSARI